ncbi:hypothetical protein ACA910_007011 [Epithemia clementina (nom. ined.)]
MSFMTTCPPIGGLLAPKFFQGAFWDELLQAGVEQFVPPDNADDEEPVPALHLDWLLSVDELEALEHQCAVACHPPLLPPAVVPPLVPEGDRPPAGPPDPPDPPPPDRFAADATVKDAPNNVSKSPAAEVEPDPHPQPPQEELDAIINLIDDGLFDNIWNVDVDVDVDGPPNNEPEIEIEEEEEQSAICKEERKRCRQHLQQPDEMTFGCGH